MNSKPYTTALALSLALIASGCSDDSDNSQMEQTSFLGDSVTVANTFEDATLTEGNQTIYGLSEPTAVSDPEVELPNYINFYDVDVSGNTITMTLVNNSDAADLILPEGRFDRYYIGFASNTVSSASLSGTGTLNEFSTVSLLPVGFTLQAQDIFQTGISVPVDFAQGGLLIELGAGTDLTETGVQLTVSIN